MNLLPLLNEDLALEYSAAIQYIQHAAMLFGPYFAFSKELLEHADDEMRHARLLNNHITYLSGIPAVIMGPVFTASENEGMLKQDLAGEETAIERYTARIGQARAQGDEATAALLQNILTDEVSHKTDLESILGV